MTNRYRVTRQQLNAAMWLSAIFIALLALVEMSAGAVITVNPGGNIQAALQPGNSVQLVAGTYPITSTLIFPSGCALTGAGPSTILDASAIGTAIKLENVGNVGIEKLTVSGAKDIGIYVNNLADSYVRTCGFSNIGGGGQINTAIFGYNPKRSDLSFNAFTNCNEGIHFFWKLGDKRTNLANRDDVSITYNQFRHIRRHPIELQEGVRGLKVRGNWIGDFDKLTNCMGISCATGGDPSDPGPYAWEIEIYENVIDGTGLQVGANYSQFAGLEVMGDTVDVHDNYIANIGQPFLVGLNSPNVKIRSNKYRGPKPSWAGGSSGMICGEYKYQAIPDANQAGNAYTTDPTPPPPVPDTGTTDIVTPVTFSVTVNVPYTIAGQSGVASIPTTVKATITTGHDGTVKKVEQAAP